MSTGSQRNALSYEDLQREHATLRGENATLRAQVAALQTTIETLRAEVAALQRGTQRQAAPFSKGTRVGQPKRAGRRPGEGTFQYRLPPLPEAVTAPLVDVPVTASGCPHCGGSFELERVEVAYRTELPPQPRPQVTAYRVTVCRCQACGRQVRGEHPEVAPDQFGATAHRLGPRLLAAAHTLHYGLGVSQRKVPAILRELTGVSVTQGALAQDAQRRTAHEVGTAYQQLRASVAEAKQVNSDDTSWRVGGETAFLMAFATATATVYQIRARHRNEEVREVVPADYTGVLGTDRGKSYDAKELRHVRQQKCIGPIQRSLSAVLATKHGRGRSFTKQLKARLREAIALWRGYHAGTAPDFAAAAATLREQLTHHLRDRALPDPDNQRLLNELGRHHDRGNLLRFLDDPQIAPTNNLAERELRPAVIARKVSQCSKNDRGAETFAAFASVTRTLARAGGSVIDGLATLFRSGRLPAHPAPLPP
ncbi:MAG: IS66 family transposase [Armatimonadetes bacterium]|nr:IS66 family transposase [Armatimonadota bacterium]